MKRSPMPRRKKRLAPVSDKRKTLEALRAVVEETVRRRDKTCVGPSHQPDVRCAGSLTVHELVQRSLWAAGIYEPDNCVLLCRAHHEWAHANIKQAMECGLLRASWEER